MSDEQYAQEHDAKREEALSTLRSFEQILDIMPDDRGTLETVILVAEECGEEATALTYRMRLAEQLAKEGDHEALALLVESLRAHPDPRAQAWIASYDQQAEGGQAAVRPGAGTEHDLHGLAAVYISEEIDLAWKLFEHGEISQEEYASLVHDLTELSTTKHHAETVSLLHTLEATQHKNLENILAYLSRASRTPYIALACFTMRPELAPLLPAEFMRSRGAIVFNTLGRELLVAVLNPFSESLRREVEQLTGKPCHYYLTRSSEFEAALVQVLKSLEN